MIDVCFNIIKEAQKHERMNKLFLGGEDLKNGTKSMVNNLNLKSGITHIINVKHLAFRRLSPSCLFSAHKKKCVHACNNAKIKIYICICNLEEKYACL